VAVGYLTLLVQFILCSGQTQFPARVIMFQQQSCYYQPHNKELVCQCREGEDKSRLVLKLREFIIQSGQEITSILIHSCPDMLLSLDFLGVNPTTIHTTVKNSQDVRIESVSFDQKYKDRQKLKMTFSNVGSATFSNLNIKEALDLEVTNVKKFVLFNSTFAHIPRRGLRTSRTDKLEIKDSIFQRVYPMSVVAEKTKVIEVMNNQFSVNAIQVISYKDGSSVFISCNRLLGDYIKPECFTTPAVSTTSTTTTTTTTRTAITTTQTIVTTTKQPAEKPAKFGVLLFTILLILLCLVILVLALVVLALCYTNWARIKKEILELTTGLPPLESKDDDELLSVQMIPEPPPPPPPVQLETLLNHKNSTKHQLFTPVWMDEIQNNKIFNKQKSINEDLKVNDRCSPAKQKEADDTLAINDNVSHEAEEKENSRTESDQEQ